MNDFQKSLGLSLVELLVTILILSILMSIAAPSFNKVMERNQLSAKRDQLQHSLNFARSEAIKQSEPLQFCASNNKTTCRADSDWSTGWIILDSTQKVLLSQTTSNAFFTIQSDNNSIFFQSDGTVDVKSTWNFCFKDGNPRKESKNTIQLEFTGRHQVATTNTLLCNL